MWDCLLNMWDCLLKKDTQGALTVVGGVVGAVIAALWTVYVYYRRTDKSSAEYKELLKKHKKLAEKNGIAKNAVKNLFIILELKHVPIEKWDQALRQLAEHHNELQQRAAQLESEDPKVQTRMALT